MTDKENIPAQALIRALNAKLREEINREIADLPQADLRGVLRMIAVWKGAEMTDKELVERLRGWAKDIQQGSTAVWAMDQDLKEAAAAIEALTAERDRLREALEGLMAHEPDYSDTLWQDARAALKGETK